MLLLLPDIIGIMFIGKNRKSDADEQMEMDFKAETKMNI
jgi:hypothetical protein